MTATSALVAAAGTGPVFVHSDPFRTAKLVRARSRTELLSGHVDRWYEFAGGRPVWAPAFNYSFPRTRTFDVAKDVAELGPLPEEFRKKRSEWRTPIPIFSIAGTGGDPAASWGEKTDPFGTDSAFAKLVQLDGTILYYGDTFCYNTIVHYAERAATGEGPPYRYDKIFPGKVLHADGREVHGSLLYHVRPLGSGLDYDWPRLLNMALERGACVRSAQHPEILVSSARSLTEMFVDELKRDPLSLLDEPTRKWVEPALEELGRRFAISDFEAPEPSWLPV